MVVISIWLSVAQIPGGWGAVLQRSVLKFSAAHSSRFEVSAAVPVLFVHTTKVLNTPARRAGFFIEILAPLRPRLLIRCLATSSL